MRKRDVPFENPTVMAKSRHDHAEDERHNRPKQGTAARPKAERSEKSKAFERRWLGGGD